jgi:pyridoxal phosphate enzyme (YggS family)
MQMELSKREKINNNYKRVVEQVNQAALYAQRDPGDIRLVVVTKTHPFEVIQCVAEAGATDFGENYVEEAIPKIKSLDIGLNWHMIGHVQSRKAQNVCEYFQYVHSVDSVKLAQRLSRFSESLNKALPIWLEFNVSGEASKFGWNIKTQIDLENIVPDIQKIASLPNLKLVGLMTVPPYSKNPEDSRIYYQRLYKFQKYIGNSVQLPDFKELSMGMSSDFEIAIQEGSTCVRIGQAILGPRS